MARVRSSQERSVSYKELEVWQRSRTLVKQIYQLTAAFPPSEAFGLTSQLRRSAISIPANIAEGYGRKSSGAYLQFLRIAKGSANELETLLILSGDLGLAGSSDDLLAEVAKLGSMLTNLIARIQAEGVREEESRYGWLDPC